MRAARFWRGLSLRWRLMAIGAAGLIAGLTVSGWLLLTALGLAFERSVDSSAGQTAADVAALIDAGQLPQPVPVAGVQVVQVVDARNRVRASSPGADRLVPILDPAEVGRALTGQHLQIGGDRAGRNGVLRVSARSAGPAADRLSVVVAVPMDDGQRALAAMRTTLLIVLPLLVAALAAVAWWVIGRTLRPVEELRTGAEGITGQRGAGAGERLPVPAGGDEIHRLAVTLNGMLDRLAAGRARQQQFVADAAHELRNPLAGMQTQLEVAQRHPNRTDWQELTDDLLADTRQLAAMAENLLILAAADETASQPDQAPDRVGGAIVHDHGEGGGGVPLQAALTALAARYRDARVPVRLGETGGTSETRGTGDTSGTGGTVIDWHPADLQRLLANLVDNAVRHARSVVWLTATTQDGDQPGQRMAAITVTDDGPGIPESDRERVFGRFVRLDDARARDDGGAGLGLAIVAELLHRHGGTITLSDAQPGLCAEIRLRLAQDPP